MTRDESQDCVGGLLEQGPPKAANWDNFEYFCIFLAYFSLAQGFWGGSKPRKHCNGSKGIPIVFKAQFADHKKD